MFNNPFMPTVPTFAARETDVSRHNGGTSGAPLKPLRYDSALKALSSLGGLRGAQTLKPLRDDSALRALSSLGGLRGAGFLHITLKNICYLFT